MSDWQVVGLTLAAFIVLVTIASALAGPRTELRNPQASNMLEEPPTGPTFGPWADHASSCRCNICR